MNQLNINKHKKNGVNIIDIKNVYIDDDVKIGIGTTVEPGVHIKNGSQIGKNVIIRPNSQISNSVISDNCEIDGAIIRDCLLYTSPSPRDLSTARMPSSA